MRAALVLLLVAVVSARRHHHEFEGKLSANHQLALEEEPKMFDVHMGSYAVVCNPETEYQLDACPIRKQGTSSEYPYFAIMNSACEALVVVIEEPEPVPQLVPQAPRQRPPPHAREYGLRRHEPRPQILPPIPQAPIRVAPPRKKCVLVNHLSPGWVQNQFWADVKKIQSIIGPTAEITLHARATYLQFYYSKYDFQTKHMNEQELVNFLEDPKLAHESIEDVLVKRLMRAWDLKLTFKSGSYDNSIISFAKPSETNAQMGFEGRTIDTLEGLTLLSFSPLFSREYLAHYAFMNNNPRAVNFVDDTWYAMVEDLLYADVVSEQDWTSFKQLGCAKKSPAPECVRLIEICRSAIPDDGFPENLLTDGLDRFKKAFVWAQRDYQLTTIALAKGFEDF